ncbi:MAG: hypothetical protein KA914_01025 [Ottowia sp.]|nr:hypothetical protein [Ottowia sp.]
MPPRARSPQLAWTAALLGALILHAALLLFGQRVVVKPPAQSRPAAWHVSFRTATAPAPAAAPTPSPAEPTAPAPVAEPLPPAPAPLPPSPRARPVAAPQPEAQPQAPAPAPPPPKPERPASASLPDSARTTSAQGGWLEATHADHSPVPIDNEWRLSDGPWPTAHPRLTLQLWISSQGVIERYEVQGEAANDRAVQALLAPFMETPMEPARIGRMPVPSTMRIELWEGDGAVPNFVGPLAPGARPGQ